MIRHQVLPTELATPTGLVATASAAGGVLATATYYYRVSATNAQGEETLAEAEVSAAVTGPTGSVALTWTAVTGATGYNVYGRTTGAELFIASATSATYTDTGAITPAGALPTTNTTGSALVGGEVSVVRFHGWFLSNADAASHQVDFYTPTLPPANTGRIPPAPNATGVKAFSIQVPANASKEFFEDAGVIFNNGLFMVSSNTLLTGSIAYS